jgi:tetratricopeptide (TPR) repeat protein
MVFKLASCLSVSSVPQGRFKVAHRLRLSTLLYPQNYSVKTVLQRLKPSLRIGIYGTAKAVPFVHRFAPVTFLLAALLVCLSAFGQQGSSLERGLELFRQEKYEAALQQFQDARRSRPADAALENFIGITETRLGRIDQANADYKTAIGLDPRLAGPHTNLGFNYFGKKQYELAEAQLKAALALDSADPFVHYYLATLYLTTSREKDAIPHIKPAEPLLENDPAAAVLAIAACLKFNASAEARTLTGFLTSTLISPPSRNTMSRSCSMSSRCMLNQPCASAASQRCSPRPGRANTTSQLRSSRPSSPKRRCRCWRR